MTELFEHKWLNEGAVPDVPLDSPSIIVADEVCYCFFDSCQCCCTLTNVSTTFFFFFKSCFDILIADRLAQLEEHRATVREVVGSNPGRTTTRGLQKTEEKVLPLL